MHEAVGTKPYSVTELPTSVGSPRESVTSDWLPYRR
jgi:hypothetical protein